MAQHHHPFLIRQGCGLAPMRIGQLGRLLNVFNQIDPRGGKALVGLRPCAAFNQGLHNTSCRDLFTATVKDLFLQLRDQSIRLVAQLDG